VSNTAFRGFGGPQGMFAIEYVVEDIARHLGKDPLEVRRRNFYGVDDRNVTQYGQVVEDNIIHDIVDKDHFAVAYLLLGKTALPATDQQRYLTLVMTPHVRSIEERLVQPDLKNDVPLYGAELATSLAAIAHLSKGFTKQPPDEVQAVLFETLNISLVVLEALPSSEVVRNKAMILMQRMILCIGNKVLDKVPRYLALLIENCTEEDVLFVSQLINQLCMKFKEEAAPVLGAALLPFLRKCSSLVPSTEDVAVTTTEAPTTNNMIPPHLRTEQLSIQKLAFAVIAAPDGF